MRKKRNIIYCIIFTGVLLLCAVSVMAYTVDQVVYDMVGPEFRDDSYFQKPWGKHEGELHGVPADSEWAHGATPGMWVDYDYNEAITAWGQVYEWAGESPVTNIRVHLRNMKLYALNDEGWQLLQDGSDYGPGEGNGYLEGTNLPEDSKVGEILSDIRTELSGGMSFTMEPDKRFLWWIATWPRPTIPEGTIAFYVTIEARLIPDDDPEVELDKAKYLLGLSADYYQFDNTIGSEPGAFTAHPRYRFLTSNWQTFTCYAGGPEPGSVEEYRNFILNNPLPPGVTAE